MPSLKELDAEHLPTYNTVDSTYYRHVDDIFYSLVRQIRHVILFYNLHNGVLLANVLLM